MIKTSLKYSDNVNYINKMILAGFTDPIDYSIDERRRVCMARSHAFEQRKGSKRRKNDVRAAKRRAAIYGIYCGKDYSAKIEPRLKKNYQKGFFREDSCGHSHAVQGSNGHARIVRENKSNSKNRFCARDIRMHDMMGLKMVEAMDELSA